MPEPTETGLWNRAITAALEAMEEYDSRATDRYELMGHCLRAARPFLRQADRLALGGTPPPGYTEYTAERQFAEEVAECLSEDMKPRLVYPGHVGKYPPVVPEALRAGGGAEQEEVRTLPSGATFTRFRCPECKSYWDVPSGEKPTNREPEPESHFARCSRLRAGGGAAPIVPGAEPSELLDVIQEFRNAIALALVELHAADARDAISDKHITKAESLLRGTLGSAS